MTLTSSFLQSGGSDESLFSVCVRQEYEKASIDNSGGSLAIRRAKK